MKAQSQYNALKLKMTRCLQRAAAFGQTPYRVRPESEVGTIQEARRYGSKGRYCRAEPFDSKANTIRYCDTHLELYEKTVKGVEVIATK